MSVAKILELIRYLLKIPSAAEIHSWEVLLLLKQKDPVSLWGKEYAADSFPCKVFRLLVLAVIRPIIQFIPGGFLNAKDKPSIPNKQVLGRNYPRFPDCLMLKLKIRG
jgi:hypothetical protein